MYYIRVSKFRVYNKTKKKAEEAGKKLAEDEEEGNSNFDYLLLDVTFCNKEIRESERTETRLWMRRTREG